MISRALKLVVAAATSVVAALALFAIGIASLLVTLTGPCPPQHHVGVGIWLSTWTAGAAICVIDRPVGSEMIGRAGPAAGTTT